MKRSVVLANLVTFWILTSAAQNLDASSLFAKLRDLAIKSDSSLKKNVVRFKQHYTWEFFFPIPKELSGTRWITIKDGQVDEKWLSRSGPIRLRDIENRMLTGQANIGLMRLFPGEFDGVRVSFSPLGPTVIIDGELYYIIECRYHNSKTNLSFEKTYWINGRTYEPVRMLEVIQGTQSNSTIMARIQVEFFKPDGFSCSLPVVVEKYDMHKTEIGMTTQGKLRVVNSEFEILPSSSDR